MVRSVCGGVSGLNSSSSRVIKRGGGGVEKGREMSGKVGGLSEEVERGLGRG